MNTAAEKLRRYPSRSGLPTIEVDGAPYHSTHDPQREAERFYASLRIEEADVILHFGWGLGYSGDVLRARIGPRARVVVFEPDEDLYKAGIAEPGARKALEDNRFQFIVGPEAQTFFDDWTLNAWQETDRILWIEWPAALRAHSAVAEDLKLRLKGRLRDRAANLLTHFRNGSTYFQNVIGNFQYQYDADVRRIFGRFRGVPLVLVSAGPSLDRNIHHLRDIASRCFILSVDTALRPLLAAEVTPHAVIIADPSELNARHVVDAMPESAYLIAEQAVHPSALQAAKRRFLFGLGLFPDSLFSKYGFGKGSLDAWGSVATCALDLACRLGANPIIFAGQDFAYSWNREYASNTIYHKNTFYIERSGTARALDVFGNSTPTTENLIAYRDYFVRRMKQSPEIRFVNATEGGILTQGVEVLPLKTALGPPAVPPVDIAMTLAECHRPSQASVDALAHLQQVLRRRRTTCDCLAGFLELTAKEHLLNKNEAGIESSILKGIEVLRGIVK
jgi:hypothetical protein